VDVDPTVKRIKHVQIRRPTRQLSIHRLLQNFNTLSLPKLKDTKNLSIVTMHLLYFIMLRAAIGALTVVLCLSVCLVPDPKSREERQKVENWHDRSP